MIPAKKILGVGEFVLDYIYSGSQHSDTLEIKSISGGGAVWNILANLAVLGDRCIAAGVVGDDDDGKLAKHHLEIINIDCSNIMSRKNHSTRLIHHIISSGKLLPGDEDHRMSMTCPVCGRAPILSKMAIFNNARGLINKEINVDIAVFDSINKARIDLVKRYKTSGIMSVLDVGRIGNLRYRPIVDILNILKHFDFLFFPEKVITFLSRKISGNRTEIPKEPETIRYLDTAAVIVTLGSRGARLYSWDTNKVVCTEIQAKEPKATVIDAAGAGDTFIAALIHSLDEKQIKNIIERKTSAGDFFMNLQYSASRAAEAIVKIGARGHLYDSDIRPVFEKHMRLLGCSLSELRISYQETSICPVCGLRADANAKHKHKSLGIVAPRNIRLLRERLMFAAEFADISNFSSVLNRLCGFGYAIGTGGSYPVAHFISDALSLGSKRFIFPIHPLDYIRNGKPSNFIIVLSYSGSTSDCAEAIRIARQMNIPEIILITGTKRPKLGSLLRQGVDSVLSYAQEAKEKGFVSIAGTIVPCAIVTLSTTYQASALNWQGYFSRIYEDSFKIGEMWKGVYLQLADYGSLDVFGSGLCWSAMLDLESKMIESGIGRAFLHESKDFSHGRFITGLKRRRQTFIIFTIGKSTGYEILLSDILAEYGEVININTNTNGVLGSLELLLKEQFLVVSIGNMLNIDISRPRIPRRALELYHWKKGLS